MILNLKNTLITFFTLLQINKNQEALVEETIVLIMQETVIALIKSLPKGKQQEIKNELAQGKTSIQIQQILNSYFSPEEYVKAMIKSSQEVFADILRETLPMLTQVQKQKVQEYISNMYKEFSLEKFKNNRTI